MRRLALIVVFCLVALPLWADYGMSNVITKQIDRDLQKELASAVTEDKVAPASASQETGASQAAPQFKKSVYYPYTIHVSSWQNKKDAFAQYKKTYQKLEGQFVTKIDLGATGIWYRIDIGYFKTVSEANARMKDLQAREIIDKEAFVGSSVPFAIELGIYPDREMALKSADKLRSEGVAPYLMKESDSVYRLLSGAFPNSKSAYPALEDITALGLQSKITKR